MKNKKSNLKNFKVESFVTSISDSNGETVKNGRPAFGIANETEGYTEVRSYLCGASASISPTEDCKIEVTCINLSIRCQTTDPIIRDPFR